MKIALDFAVWILLFLLWAEALPHEDTDDIETKAKANFQSARHLRFDGDLMIQPDENVITVDRVRALLRSGVTSIKYGNKTIANNSNWQKQQQQQLPKPTETPILKNVTTSKNASLEEEYEDDSENEPISTTTLKPENATSKSQEYKALKEAATRLKQLLHSTTTLEPKSSLVTDAFVTEDDDDGKIHLVTNLSTKEKESASTLEAPVEEGDKKGLALNEAQLQYLQAQVKRIQSATVHNNSSEWLVEPAITPTAAPIEQETIATTTNFLAQLFRGFSSLGQPATPPPSPFKTNPNFKIKLPTSTSTTEAEKLKHTEAATTTPTTTKVETEATIPFEEPTTTTTEAPLPPPEPDYVLASKQLQPFVSGVKVLESGSTRDALDAASQMGKLTWLINYYETQQQQSDRQ